MSLAVVASVNLFSGALNTVIAKWMDEQKIGSDYGVLQADCDSTEAGAAYSQPFLQAWLMMLGELLCLVVFSIMYLFANESRRANLNVNRHALKFSVPNLCDWTGTTLIFASYAFITASTIQMLRGSSVVLTCLVSKFYLGRQQHPHHILGVVLVTAGLVFVALSSIVGPKPDELYAEQEKLGNPVVGIMIVLGAQLAVCMQWIIEEKLNTKNPIHPLLAIGTEGSSGFLIGIPILIAAELMGAEVTKGFRQTSHCRDLFLGSMSLPLSIAFFNASGFAITKMTGATARSTIDASRTVLVWVMCMYLGWESFKWLQFIGFIVLITGTSMYNNLIVIKCLLGEEEKAEMEKALLESTTKESKEIMDDVQLKGN